MAISASHGPKKRSPKKPSSESSLFGTAPGALLGFGLQYTRLTTLLLSAPPGSTCSLEVLDDASTCDLEGSTVLVQSKSALTDNPAADRAVGLWKALHNWIVLIEQGAVNPKDTTFELYVSRQVTGTVVKRLHECADTASAVKLVLELRTEFWGQEPDYALRKTLPKSIAPFINKVLSAKLDHSAELITNFRLECGSGSPQADLQNLLSLHPIARSKRQDMAEYLTGWVKSRVDHLLECGLPASVPKDEFFAKFRAHCILLDRDLVLKSRCPVPTEDERRARLKEPDCFLRQLDLIDVDYEEKLEAVGDFMRASNDRTRWAADGEVDEAVFEELDESLKRTWKNKERANAITHSTKLPIERGRLLYYECAEHKTQVMQQDVPAHFVPGCFHVLADGKHIGWHPDFKSLLR